MDLALLSFAQQQTANATNKKEFNKISKASRIANGNFVKGTGYGGGTGTGMSKTDLKRSEAVAASNLKSDKLIETSLRAIMREMTVASKEKLSSCNHFIAYLHALLRNDSLFDISERGDLYRALLELLSAIAQEPFLSSLLNSRCPTNDGEETSDTILSLLKTLSCQASQFVRLHQGSAREDDDDGVDLVEKALLMALHIEAVSAECSLCIQQAESLGILPPSSTSSGTSSSASTGRGIRASPEQARRRQEETEYLREMQPLRFEAIPLLEEIQAKRAAHCFFPGTKQPQWSAAATNAGSSSASTSRGWTARVAAEMSGLMSSLPVYAASAVFVRCDEARMDVIKALVIAPEDTPYANGCFEFDILLPPTYPQIPPQVRLCTTGGGTVRFNPNLYNCGKVCLSLLGTWSGPGWEPGKSTLLQVLVSIQSLIFVGDPYFNEPGYQRSMGTPEGTRHSKEYNAVIRCATARHAILAQLKDPSPSPIFREVILKHFRIKRETVLRQLKEWGKESPAIVAIEKEVTKLLSAIVAPICLEDEDVAAPVVRLGAVPVRRLDGETSACGIISSNCNVLPPKAVFVDLCSDDDENASSSSDISQQNAAKRQKLSSHPSNSSSSSSSSSNNNSASEVINLT